MNRREFFSLTGLGAGALFLAPKVLASAWTAQWRAEDAVKFAISYARAKAAVYADARIGTCEIIGQKGEFPALDLLETEMLGMRICTPSGWRKFVIRDFDENSLKTSLDLALDDNAAIQPNRDYWISANFCKGKVLAHHSTDAKTESQLNAAMLRYGQKLAIPENGQNILFCDILLHQ